MVTIRQHEQEASAEYTECTQCGVEELSGDIVDIDDRKLCKDCIYEFYTKCSDCDQWVANGFVAIAYIPVGMLKIANFMDVQIVSRIILTNASLTMATTMICQNLETHILT